MSTTDNRAMGWVRWERTWPWVVVLGVAVLGLGLIIDQARRLSATYDEVTYLKVGADWWRTGQQATISRMGSPLLFWKIQQAPTLWWIDRYGDRSWIDAPIDHQADLLPWIRIGASWIWLVGLGVVAAGAWTMYGSKAMALAAAVYACSPNLLAHGALVTMELPIVATSSAMLFTWIHFLRTGSRLAFWGTAALGGLAFSCKYTAVLVPPILALIWAIDLWVGRDRACSQLVGVGRVCRTVVGWSVPFVVVLLGTNLCLTGFALIPLSARSGSHPVLERSLPAPIVPMLTWLLERSYPQDWVGFATQVIYQRAGGPSYLLGERRSSGWWYYYLVTLAVKVPLAAWLLMAARCSLRPLGELRSPRRDWVLPVYLGLFLLAAMFGSKRNYGVRYLLPLSPVAIVYVSALATRRRSEGWIWRAGLLGMMVAVATIHPNELAYFNLVAGGPAGGRRILADSNLDWGQGARAMAQLQADQPEYRDLTWYYFGDTDPAHYGVVGPRYGFDAHRPPPDLPPRVTATTRYLAVSASLQWGPWGPEGYFGVLNDMIPVCFSRDQTVAIYRTTDLLAITQLHRVKTGRGHE